MMTNMRTWIGALALLAIASSGCSAKSEACNFDDFMGLSCVAIMLTGNVGSKVDTLFVFYTLFTDTSRTTFTTRADSRTQEPANLPIEIPVMIDFNPPFESPVVDVIVTAVLEDVGAVGVANFTMKPKLEGKTQVTAPLAKLETSNCVNGTSDFTESGVDCGGNGERDFRTGYSSNVVGMKNHCLPCDDDQICFDNSDCLSRNCVDNFCRAN